MERKIRGLDSSTTSIFGKSRNKPQKSDFSSLRDLNVFKYELVEPNFANCFLSLFIPEGIHSSISAGLAAGEVAGKASQEGDVSKSRLSEFNEKYKPWLDRIRKSLKVMRILETLSDDDFNMLADILEDQDIIDLANGLNVLRVARKLMLHPKLAAKLAKPLLTI